MGMFSIFGASGIRNAMKKSYFKHYKMAMPDSVRLQKAETSPHQAGLYGALGSRIQVRGQKIIESVLWMELFPFMLMDENVAIEALAEYAVYQELPQKADIELLGSQINSALDNPRNTNFIKHLGEIISESQSSSNEEITITSFGAFAFLNNLAWIQLLGDALYQDIEIKARQLMQDIEDES